MRPSAPKPDHTPQPLPALFLERMSALLGEEYSLFLDAQNQPPSAGLRINTLKISPAEFLAGLPWPASAVPWCPAGLLLDTPPAGDESGKPTAPAIPSPGRHPAHAAGLYYLQDPAAMAAAELLAPMPGERVLDLAAAPGGKSTHLAAKMANQGLLVCNEIHPRRAWDLAENLERSGVRHAVITNETPERLANHFGPFFDRVLLDAPCSGEGMFRKNPQARSEWSLGHVQSCAMRQANILQTAGALVRPGGWLVYSTCTFNPEENEQVIARFLDEQAGQFELCPANLHSPHLRPGKPGWLPAGSDHPELASAVRIWPQYAAAEGHFLALMHRLPDPAGAPPAKASSARSARLAGDDLGHLTEFWGKTLHVALPEALSVAGSYIYAMPPGDMPSLHGLRVLHPGWWLGALKKGRFEPSHALALGLTAAEARQTHCLAGQALAAYLRGESLPASGENGWVLVTMQFAGREFPLGWGRRTGEILKNAYPHGLRRAL